MGISSISVVIGLLILIFGIILFIGGQRPKVAIALMVLGVIVAVAPVTLIYLLLD